MFGRHKYALSEPIQLDDLRSKLWLSDPFGFDWQYNNLSTSGRGSILGIKYYPGHRLRWRKITPTFQLAAYQDGLRYVLAKDPYWDEVNVSHSANWWKGFLGLGLEFPISRYVRLAFSGNYYFGTALNVRSTFYEHKLKTQRRNFPTLGLSLSFSYPSKIGEWRIGGTSEAGRHFISTAFPSTNSTTGYLEIPLGFLHSPTTVLIYEHQMERSNLPYRLLRTKAPFGSFIALRQENNGIGEYITLASKIREGLGPNIYFNLVYEENTKDGSNDMCMQIEMDDRSLWDMQTLFYITLIGDQGEAVMFLPKRAYESRCGHRINREDLERLIYSERVVTEFHDRALGVFIKVDNMYRVQENWRVMYEGYLRERFESLEVRLNDSR